jgi:hypothetical protein
MIPKDQEFESIVDGRWTFMNPNDGVVVVDVRSSAFPPCLNHEWQWAREVTKHKLEACAIQSGMKHSAPGLFKFDTMP